MKKTSTLAALAVVAGLGLAFSGTAHADEWHGHGRGHEEHHWVQPHYAPPHYVQYRYVQPHVVYYAVPAPVYVAPPPPPPVYYVEPAQSINWTFVIR